jgi:hypothetical protein
VSGGGPQGQRSSDAEMSVGTEILKCVPPQKRRCCSEPRNTLKPRTLCRMIPQDVVVKLRAARGELHPPSGALAVASVGDAGVCP